ncbi:uncharacterized protein B0H64DRAFT_412361 [Chaetomium fimeti]|uniref:Mitochondrial intermembrane space import and assembly protein 40 n=1 Tax=Chaetomium fimeti TaxID=1854472 RepID=A0AAE0H5W6_9PEZI|nr:hypothetical protein B0H64DRAFT_412361 [Chaetomium fimeti]
MYRTALRSAPSALRAAQPILSSGSRRFASTTTRTSKKGTWKGTGMRWGLAAAAVYFYNTSPIFADELPPEVGPAPAHFSDADLPTVEAMIEEKRRQVAAAAPPPPPKPTKPTEVKAVEAKVEEAKSETTEETKPAVTEKEANAEANADAAPAPENAPEPGSPEALEQEAAQQGAFDPETGEINWGCPCLGGMADGPCGEEFKAAFSCFVYSKDEPKGMDCVDKFQHMQDCFRKYPEIYGSELTEDDEEENAQAQEVAKEMKTNEETTTPPQKAPEVAPKQATDATEANKEKKQ